VIPSFLHSLVAATVWLIANGVYLDMRRKGAHGFGRFVAFWAGLPATVITLLAVRAPGMPPLEPPPDDEARLLAEIRVDRELRGRSAPPEWVSDGGGEPRPRPND
jgi:membrane-bound metal-dependent hydrolase YbcI (DUF457 family)